jgi:HD-GYP domain-containing protein (c-di-GMP phosphodiesterase class II)
VASNEPASEAPSPIERSRYERNELLAISRALSSERDIRKLLDLILDKSRRITGADAGSVYVLEAADADGNGQPDSLAFGNPARSPRALGEMGRRHGSTPAGGLASRPARLHFMLSQNDSIPVDFKEFTLPVDDTSLAGRAALAGRPINVPDVEQAKATAGNPAHNRSFDDKIGYRARSMLTVPMLSAEGEVIGVIQLINKKRRPSQVLATPADFEEGVVPFDERAEEMALALASQAGVSLENAILYDEIRRLFESFVDASVTAIESRDPTTSGHSRRVATLSVALAEKVDAVAEGPLAAVHFSRDDLRQIEYAGVLHDFGKVGVREQVLVKAKKLYDWQLEVIRLRLAYVRKAIEAESLRKQLEHVRQGGSATALAAIEKQRNESLAALDECWHLVQTANEPTVLEQPVLARLTEVAAWTYVDEVGQARPYLLTDEVAALQVSRGSLTPLERQQIESHVNHTVAFLQTIPWGRRLRRVPQIAGAHHELLNGAGYPVGLRAADIPVEARMLTIADIFDALTAADRPYKAAVPVQRALAIIESEVKAGKCDADLFRVFVDAEIYKRVL